MSNWNDQMERKEQHEHCWHVFSGPYSMVLHDGEVLMECCKCHEHKTIHRDHLHDRRHAL